MVIIEQVSNNSNIYLTYYGFEAKRSQPTYPLTINEPMNSHGLAIDIAATPFLTGMSDGHIKVLAESDPSLGFELFKRMAAEMVKRLQSARRRLLEAGSGVSPVGAEHAIASKS